MDVKTANLTCNIVSTVARVATAATVVMVGVIVVKALKKVLPPAEEPAQANDDEFGAVK